MGLSLFHIFKIGLPDKGRASKVLVVCNSWDVLDGYGHANQG